MFICRLTLLLGPPSSGKTTLLLALAGRLGQDLQVYSLFLMLFCWSIYRIIGSNYFLLAIRSMVLYKILLFSNTLISSKMSGNVTYNGHGLKEFVPQRTSAYVSQQDWHVPEMTVRETLDFSARCQGVGCKYGNS